MHTRACSTKRSGTRCALLRAVPYTREVVLIEAADMESDEERGERSRALAVADVNDMTRAQDCSRKQSWKRFSRVQEGEPPRSTRVVQLSITSVMCREQQNNATDTAERPERQRLNKR